MCQFFENLNKPQNKSADPAKGHWVIFLMEKYTEILSFFKKFQK